jgi:iron(III) transport system substrate-binding protein
VNHYYLHRFIAEQGESFAARNYYTRAADPGSVVLVAGAGMLEESDNKDVAKQFIKFLLSASGQQYFASQTYEFPLNDNAKPNNLLPALADITKPSIDLGDLIDLEGTQDLLREVGALP